MKHIYTVYAWKSILIILILVILNNGVIAQVRPPNFDRRLRHERGKPREVGGLGDVDLGKWNRQTRGSQQSAKSRAEAPC